MKVLFLSIRGILNSNPLSCHYGSDYVDKDMMNLLNEIIKYTNAKIVLNFNPKFTSLKKKFVEENIQDCVFGANAIKRWLQKNPIEKYAILDDETDYRDINQFKTDPEIGLTREIAKKVIKHLGRVK